MPVKGRMARTMALGAMAAALLGGCTSLRDHRGYLIDQALLDSVQPGIDNQQSVERTLGRPTFVSQFGEKAWYYVAMDTKSAAFTRAGSPVRATRPKISSLTPSAAST